MVSVIAKVKNWSLLIKSGEIANLSEEIEKSVSESRKSYEQHLCKLIRFIAHFCGNSANTGKRQENDLWLLANSIYSNVENVPTTQELLASLYHIMKYLIEAELYEEAKIICDKHLLGADYSVFPDKYLSISFVWFNAAKRLLEKLGSKFDNKDYEFLILCIEQDCTILKAGCLKHVKYILSRLAVHLESMNNVKNNAMITDFRKTVLSYLGSLNLSMPETEKEDVYKRISNIIKPLISRTINGKGINEVKNVLDELQPVLSKILRNDADYYKCLNLYFKLCSIITQPFEKLDGDAGKNVTKYIESMKTISAIPGMDSAVMVNSVSAYVLLESLCDCWTSMIKSTENRGPFKDFFTSIFDLAWHAQSILKTKKTESCCSRLCEVKEDLYNPIVLQLRVLSTACKLFDKPFYPDILLQAVEFILDIVSSIYTLKQKNCKNWSAVWKSTKLYIIRFGDLCREEHPEKSVDLFSLLCSAIVHLEEFDSGNGDSESIVNALRRLAHVHYTQKRYEEALVTAAFGCLFSAGKPDSKVFKLWRGIKRDSPEELKVIPLADFIIKNLDKIEDLGLRINLADFDLKELCLAEIQALLECKADLTSAIIAVLGEIEIYEKNSLCYIRGVELLGLHVANAQKTCSISGYVEKARCKLRDVDFEARKTLCQEANLDFCAFVDELNQNKMKTEEEMKNVNVALRATKKALTEEEEENAVPFYSLINVREDMKLMKSLKTAMEKWKETFKSNFDIVVQGWQPKFTLKIITSAGEFARLHNFYECELLAWKLAYKLADALNDKQACIEIVGRSISLRYIREDWIQKAREYAESLISSREEEDVRAVASFWIELANLHFRRNQCKEATQLLNKVEKLLELGIDRHPVMHLQLQRTVMENYLKVKDNANHMDYSHDVVCTFYAILCLYDAMERPKCDISEGFPFVSAVYCDVLSRLAMNINSLLGYRELSAHLIKQLETVQKLSSTLRVATILKDLCFIDILRTQLDDCEVKLAGLEHILDLETNQRPTRQKPKNPRIKCESSPTSPVRDAGAFVKRNGASPILVKKSYDEPSFLDHGVACSCYKCKNYVYQSLVFSATHIRAQLYAMKDSKQMAIKHFQGAISLRTMLLKNELKVLKRKKESPEERSFWLSPQALADWVYFLIDFSRFMKKFERNRVALDLAKEAMEICDEYHLESHAVYATTEEYLAEFYYSTDDHFKFTVPLIEDIDVQDLLQENNPATVNCATPSPRAKSKLVFENVEKLEPKSNSRKYPMKKALQKALEMKSPNALGEEAKEAKSSAIGRLKSGIASDVVGELDKLVKKKMGRVEKKSSMNDLKTATSSKSSNFIPNVKSEPQSVPRIVKQRSKVTVIDEDENVKEATRLMDGLVIDKTPNVANNCAESQSIVRRSARNVTRKKN